MKSWEHFHTLQLRRSQLHFLNSTVPVIWFGWSMPLCLITNIFIFRRPRRYPAAVVIGDNIIIVGDKTGEMVKSKFKSQFKAHMNLLDLVQNPKRTM